MHHTRHSIYTNSSVKEVKATMYNIPVHGLQEEYTNILELVKAANLHYKNGNFSGAVQIWENAVDVGNEEAAYYLAKVLKETEIYPMQLQRLERFRKSEQLLLTLWNRYSDHRIDLELADLYYRCGTGKYASALGHLLRAKINGAHVEPRLIEAYQKRLAKESVDASNDPHGAYLLGSALIDAGSLEKGIYFLEQAIEYGCNRKWVAYAALELSQACDGHPEYTSLHFKMLNLAKDLGFPEILHVDHQRL